MSTACKRLIVFSDAAATFSRANNGAFLYCRKKSGVRKGASSTTHSASGQRPSQSAARCPLNDRQNGSDDDAAVFAILDYAHQQAVQRTRACNARDADDRRRFAARRFADRRYRLRHSRVRDLWSARAHERADRSDSGLRHLRKSLQRLRCRCCRRSDSPLADSRFTCRCAHVRAIRPDLCESASIAICSTRMSLFLATPLPGN